MEPQFAPAREPAGQAVWESLLRPLAGDLRGQIGALSATVVTSIRGDFPELFEAPGSFEENIRATEANLALFADILGDGLDPREIALPPATTAFARASVERGVPLTGALRSLRLGHAVLFGHVLSELRARAADAETLERAVALIGAWSFALVDALSVLAEEAYESERDRWLRSASALQAEVIERLLSGEPPDVAIASRQLGYELNRPQLGIVAWAQDPPPDQPTVTLLEDAVARIAEAMGAGRPLTQSRGTHMLAAWIGPGEDSPAVESLRVELDPRTGVRVAAGRVGAGIAGFRASHEQALLARRVAALTARAAGTVTAFDRVALVSLATADLRQARDFVSAVLGPLAPVDDLTRRLAATIQVYLEEEASSSRTARRLGIHENTVRYRIRQTEELLGRPVTSRAVELEVALRVADAARGTPPGDGS